MHIQHIRNATLKVTYAGQTFLIDPYLGEKGAYAPFPNPSADAPQGEEKNPLVDLPVSIDELIEGVDAVIVTHTHPDHWDEAAKQTIPKDMKIFVQNEEEATTIKEDDFSNVEVLSEQTTFADIQVVKTRGEHGRGEILKVAGDVCGVVFKHTEEQILYVAGDTVWYDGVQKEIETHRPEVIVVNAGDNQFAEGGSLVMSKEDVHLVYETAPHATIIAVHMEAVNHWTLSRDELKTFAKEKGIERNLSVPDDGEVFTFEKKDS